MSFPNSQRQTAEILIQKTKQETGICFLSLKVHEQTQGLEMSLTIMQLNLKEGKK